MMIGPIGKAKRQKSSLKAFALVLMVVFPTTAIAEAPEVPSAKRHQSETLSNWLERMQAYEDFVAQRQWKKARRGVDTLLEEMCERIRQEGEVGAALLSRAAFIRALAHGGLENDREALWDFGMALALNPEMESIDLSAYGEAAEELVEKPLPPLRFPSATVEGPKRRYAPGIKYPYGKKSACKDGPVLVQAVIGVDGVPGRPRLMTLSQPVLGFAAMEALREWRFRPATENGKPIEAIYNLTVNFDLPACLPKPAP